TGSEVVAVRPVVTIAAPNVGLVNQPVTFTLGTKGDPAGTILTWYIDWDSDGYVDQTVTGPSGITVTHTYSSPSYGSYLTQAAVYVWDPNVGLSDPAYRYVSILDVAVTVQADPADSTRQI